MTRCLSIFFLLNLLPLFGQLNAQQNNSFGAEDGPLTIQNDSAQISKPRYLGINGWRQCLEQEQLNSNGVGSLLVWCLPSAKPEECAIASWDELNALEGGERIENCLENPMRMTNENE